MTTPLAPSQPHPADEFLEWAKGVDRLIALQQQHNEFQDLKLDTLSADLRELKNTVAQNSDAIEDLKITMRARFAEVNARFDGVDAKFDGLKAEVGGLKAEVGGLKAEVGGLKAEVADVRSLVMRVLTLLGDKPAA